jgi:hypothetical protein
VVGPATEAAPAAIAAVIDAVVLGLTRSRRTEARVVVPGLRCRVRSGAGRRCAHAVAR